MDTVCVCARVFVRIYEHSTYSTYMQSKHKDVYTHTRRVAPQSPCTLTYLKQTYAYIHTYIHTYMHIHYICPRLRRIQYMRSLTSKVPSEMKPLASSTEKARPPTQHSLRRLCIELRRICLGTRKSRLRARRLYQGTAERRQ